MRIVQCKMNHLKNPLGFQVGKPVFSYLVQDSKGSAQTEARIKISRCEDMKETCFDTGFAEDIDSVAYEANVELYPRQRYYWTVTVRTDAGEEATSDVNWFETGKMYEAWKGKWITCEDYFGQHPVFWKHFTVEKAIRRARLYVCGLGLYEAFFNGKKIGDEFLTPYCNDYEKWLQYQTFDVTEQMKAGGILEILLGNGWYKGRFGFINRVNNKSFCINTWKVIAELIITYEDGCEEIVGTDEAWNVYYSRIKCSSIYDGEIWDFTLPMRKEGSVKLCEETLPPLMERLSVPVRIQEELKPKEMMKTASGDIILDIGQNIAGIFRVKVHEPKGRKIRLQFGEILQNGEFYRDNLRSAKAEFEFTSDGKAHILQPHFTYYGYRYVKVEGISQVEPQNFTACVLYSDIPKTGTLQTGNRLVNRLIKNAEWGQKGNFIDVPTDCPQRDERMGWTGDAQVFSKTACFLRDSFAFYKKYLFDIWQEQQKTEGLVPNVIPSWGDRETSSAWGDAACIIPWNLYLFYGDKSILRQQYSSMKAWVDYIERCDGDKKLWRKKFHLGDWLALDHHGEGDEAMGGTDTGFIASVYYANSANILSKAAETLGYRDDAKYYKKLSEHLFLEIKSDYYTDDGNCKCDTQTALLLTLHYGLSKEHEKIKKRLLEKFKVNQYKLQTGFVGTPLLCNQLCEEKMEELAFALLLNEEYPGWLYEVKMGATTIWERWNSVLPDGTISSTGMNSLNHYAYGSIVEWIYQYVAGIRPVEKCPGFRMVRIEPIVSWELQSVKAECKTPAGTYRSSWEILDEYHLRLSFFVPFGGMAEVVLPSVQEEIWKEKKEGEHWKLLPGDYTIEYRTRDNLRMLNCGIVTQSEAIEY